MRACERVRHPESGSILACLSSAAVIPPHGLAPARDAVKLTFTAGSTIESVSHKLRCGLAELQRCAMFVSESNRALLHTYPCWGWTRTSPADVCPMKLWRIPDWVQVDPVTPPSESPVLHRRKAVHTSYGLDNSRESMQRAASQPSSPYPRRVHAALFSRPKQPDFESHPQPPRTVLVLPYAPPDVGKNVCRAVLGSGRETRLVLCWPKTEYNEITSFDRFANLVRPRSTQGDAGSLENVFSTQIDAGVHEE